MVSRPGRRKLGYREFGNWYDEYRETVLEPTLDRAASALDELLVEALSDRDLSRIRSTSARVKSKRRTWRKINQARYRGRINAVGDIPGVVDDLVGLRVTCVNVRDIEMVQDVLDGLPTGVTAPPEGFAIDPTSERDYVTAPKESGYRGWHVNLRIATDGGPAQTCELQVRTLLQDGWGELTHADTYSKDGELPPLVEVLSKRMADLLATLDNIAEDLRTELDRIDDAAVAEPATEATGPSPEVGGSGGGEQADDATALLIERWAQLDRPIDLAALAWALQREFGAEISDHWFGYRTFKQFLRAALPDAEISTGRRAYLLPSGAAPRSEEQGETEPQENEARIPDLVVELRQVDSRFPLLETGSWATMFRIIAEVWSEVGPGEPDNRLVNRLARAARDRAAAAGIKLSRRHLDYVIKALLATEDSGEPLDQSAIAAGFADHTWQRLVDLRIAQANQLRRRQQVERWLSQT